jgi:anti-anti-sigma factor
MPYRITISGSVGGDNFSQTEAAVLTELQAAGNGPVILDLRNAGYIDSRGISLCIRMYKLCAAKKTDFCIETSSVVYRLFATTNLTTVLNIRESNPG